MTETKRVALLKNLSEYRTGPYRVFSYYDSKTSHTKEEVFKKKWGSSSYRACFSNYMRDGFKAKKVGAGEVQFYPLFIKYDLAFNQSLVEKSIYGSEEEMDAYLHHFDRTIFELNMYIKVEYSTEHKIISIFPEKTLYRPYMLAWLTRLRTLFELPYALTSSYAELFQEDFPELDLGQITYLLDTFIVKSGSGHGLFRSYGFETIGEYMPLSEILERASSGKYSSINSAEKSIIPIKTGLKLKGFGKYHYPDDFVSRYKLILQNKEEIFSKIFKKINYEESVSSI